MNKPHPSEIRRGSYYLITGLLIIIATLTRIFIFFQIPSKDSIYASAQKLSAEEFYFISKIIFLFILAFIGLLSSIYGIKTIKKQFKTTPPHKFREPTASLGPILTNNSHTTKPLISIETQITNDPGINPPKKS